MEQIITVKHTDTYRDGGTKEYQDKDGNLYFVPPGRRSDVYNSHPSYNPKPGGGKRLDVHLHIIPDDASFDNPPPLTSKQLKDLLPDDNRPVHIIIRDGPYYSEGGIDIDKIEIGDITIQINI